MRRLLPFLAIIALIPCREGRAEDPLPTYRIPNVRAAQVFLRDGTEIRCREDVDRLARKLPGSKAHGTNPVVWDLGGGVLRGDKQKGDGGQDEHQEPLFRARIPLVVKNGFVRRNKNAALFMAPNSGMDGITFTEIGEDAVATTQGAHGFTLKRCEFVNHIGGDKSAQLNEARGAVVAGNFFHSGRTAVRVGDDHTTRIEDLAVVRDNHFHAVDTAIHASRISVREWDNRYDKVRVPLKTACGARISSVGPKTEG